MDNEQFTNNAPGKVVQSWHEGNTYIAFDPDPLPPLLNFDITLVHVLSEADRALGELAGLGRTIGNPQLLIGPFMRREAVLSSRIEGTQTGMLDLYAFEAGQTSLPGFPDLPPKEDTQEIINYIEALRYGIERIEQLPICLRLIRELHACLMQGVRGQNKTPGMFRTRQNWIGSVGTPLPKATFVPPPVEHMQRALDELEHYISSDCHLPPLIRIALIHYQFEVIHPFLDGNGRVGRLLISLLLIAWKMLPAPLLYLSVFFEKNKKQYYDLLLAVSQCGAWNEWFTFFLRGVAEQAHDAVERAKQFQDLRGTWRTQMTQTRSSAHMIALVDSLFEYPVLTIPRAKDFLGVTYPSAQKNVQKLVDAGILKSMDESTYNKIFIAEDIIRIVMDYES